jgi:hypothetical protein
MWATVGRFQTDGDTDDASLARTTQALADGAAQMPGHISTRLFGTPDREALFCVTRWGIEASARSYVSVMQEQPEAVASGYGGEVLEMRLVEEIAGYPPD